MAWRPSALNVYRVLLFAYPAEFRHEYAGEMERLFIERRSTEPLFSLWLAILGDVARNAPREHLHILAADLRHGLRLFAKAPGFVSAALLALALGIGAATTVFSVVNAVLLRSLPYGGAERLVYLWTPLPRYQNLPREIGPSFADVMAWRASSRSFSEIAILRQRPFMIDVGDGVPLWLGGAFVSGNFLRAVQAPPRLGRAIDENDDRPGHDHVALISDALWSSQFGRDPGVLARSFQLGPAAYRIIGVMPPDFAYPRDHDLPHPATAFHRTDIWIPSPLGPRQLANRLFTTDVAIGRLRPGVSLRQAQSEMTAIENGLDPLNLPEMRGMQALLVSFIETTAGPLRPLMRLLGGAVLLVLLIACGNVANLLMARAVARVHEMGVRTAMGAPRARLVRQLLSESLLLSAAGGALGALFAVVALRMVQRLNPGDIPRLEEASIDARVLLVAVALSLATGLLSGILPAVAASRINVAAMLRLGGGRGLVGGAAFRTRHALIVGEVALAVILLAGAGLLIRSYLNVMGQDKGFAPSTLTMKLGVDLSSRRPPQQLREMWQTILARAGALPGIEAVGAITHLPLSHEESTSTFRVEGYPNVPNQSVDLRQVGGDYFQAMQIRLVAGRLLAASDNPLQPPRIPAAVLVSEAFARRYFAGGNAVGGHVQRGAPGSDWSTIVGVVADVRHSSLEKPPEPVIYEPSWLLDSIAIRTALPPGSAVSSVRAVLHEVDPHLALANIQTMSQRTGAAESRRKFQTVLLAAFAVMALFLALFGLAGLLSYAVRQRSAEIGVRMALGAGRSAVIAMVVRQGLLLTAAGLGIGLLAAFAIARAISSMLYAVRVFDPLTFIAVPLLLLLAAGIACLLPAWKAARVDPIASLRAE